MAKTFLLSVALALVGVILFVVGFSVHQTPPAPGAVVGPSVDGPYFSVGGLQTYEYVTPILASSSVLCNIKNPWAPATSTVKSIVVNIATSSATGLGIAAQTYDVSTTTAAGGFGSSSPAFIFAHSVAAVTGSNSVRDSVSWQPISTTTRGITTTILAALSGGGADGSSPFFIAGSQSLSVRIATATPGTFSTYYQGTCSVILQKQ